MKKILELTTKIKNFAWNKSYLDLAKVREQMLLRDKVLLNYQAVMQVPVSSWRG